MGRHGRRGGQGEGGQRETVGIVMMPTVSSVREGGVEPPRPCGHWNLNPARLPIPPPAHLGVVTSGPTLFGATAWRHLKISTSHGVDSHPLFRGPSGRTREEGEGPTAATSSTRRGTYIATETYIWTPRHRTTGAARHGPRPSRHRQRTADPPRAPSPAERTTPRPPCAPPPQDPAVLAARTAPSPAARTPPAARPAPARHNTPPRSPHRPRTGHRPHSAHRPPTGHRPRGPHPPRCPHRPRGARRPRAGTAPAAHRPGRSGRPRPLSSRPRPRCGTLSTGRLYDPYRRCER